MQRSMHSPLTCLLCSSQSKQSDAWRPLGRRFGGVTLAGHPGAVATVEATWVPLASGSLPVPVLSLQASNCSVIALCMGSSCRPAELCLHVGVPF